MIMIDFKYSINSNSSPLTNQGISEKFKNHQVIWYV